MNKNIACYYDSRESRNAFIATELFKYIGSTVLNIGGTGKKYLAKHLPVDVNYKELDIAGNPDFKVNLEKETPVDLEDNSFETVICTEVLEHLDNFHAVYFDLIRLASKWVIISLPNSLHGIDLYQNKQDGYNTKKAGITRGKNLKFYGLPVCKPEDRHKWFFSYSEAKFFLEYYANQIGFDVVRMFPAGAKETSRKKILQKEFWKIILNEKQFIDKYSSSIWCVMDVSNKKAQHEIEKTLVKALAFSS